MNIFHTRHTAHTTQSLNTRQSVKHVPVFVLYYTEKFIFYTRHTTYTFQSVKHVPVFLLYYTEWYIFHTRRTAHTTQNVNTLQSVKHVPVPLPYYIELYIVYTRQNYSYHSGCEYPSEKRKKKSGISFTLDKPLIPLRVTTEKTNDEAFSLKLHCL